jgi:hypothetical protein
VKTGYGAGLRKGSWEPRLLTENKENQAVKEEENEDEEDYKGVQRTEQETDGHDDETVSEAGTERRTSYTGTFDDSMSYVTDSQVSTSTDRRTASYGSTNAEVSASWVSRDNKQHDDDDDEGDRETETNTDRDESSMMQSEAGEEDDSLAPLPAGSELVLYGHNDSGLGTDLASASEKGSAVGTTAAG